jgi:hypothetical protein
MNDAQPIALAQAAETVSKSAVRQGLHELAECMVRRVNAREKLLDEGKSASMYPAFRWRVFSWP